MNEDRNDLPPENSQPSNSRPTSQKGKLVCGILLGVLGTPLLALITSAPAVIVVAALFAAGYLTASSAKSTGAKVGMTLLFGFGYALLLLGIFFVTCIATWKNTW